MKRPCSAKTQSGRACHAQAVAGATVCRVHGGSAPQVIAAAKMRLIMASDPAAARVVQMALSRRQKPADVLAACREILNRAGVVAPAETTSSADTGVLWEELIQIHRRRVGELPAPTLNGHANGNGHHGEPEA